MRVDVVNFAQNIPFSGLIQDELTQIRISRYIVHFLFTQGSEITIESDFEHVDRNGEIISRFDVYTQSGEETVHRLLGKTVTSVSVESGDALRISFDNNESIRIRRNESRVESCTLLLERKMYVVS
jgi:hypothetical protein